jgi:NADH-quinone oxidoreductase subunit M
VYLTYTVISATAVIITAAYYLWSMQRVFLGKLNPAYVGFPDVNWRERLTLYPLAVVMIFLGFYPQFILHAINPTLQMLIQNLRPV